MNLRRKSSEVTRSSTELVVSARRMLSSDDASSRQLANLSPGSFSIERITMRSTARDVPAEGAPMPAAGETSECGSECLMRCAVDLVSGPSKGRTPAIS